MIEEYLKTRPNLTRTYMLVDSRHKPSESDILMYKYLKYFNLPVTIIATKVDKISKNKREKSKNVIIKTLQLDKNDTFIAFSNATREGKDKVLKELEDLVMEETL